MHKLVSVIFCFVVSSVCFSQAIRVNDVNDAETNLTAEELVRQVLISGGGCGDVSFTNLEENPAGSTSINNRSWGYFDANNSNFPFERGIILSSGSAKEAEGPNTRDGNNFDDASGAWPGDQDLTDVLRNQYGGTQQTMNATVFEFTFVPINNTISFDFIFASEEYENQFECDPNFRDGFAFLLEGDGVDNDPDLTFNGSNIAAIPGSDNVPVSTASIHANSFTCGDENEGVNYFPDLYVSNSGSNNQNEIEFDGYTQVLTAQSPVTPGETYTIKLVVGDRLDANYNSAVFFRAGSFNLGVDLGSDLTIAAGTAGCEDETITLDVTDGTENAMGIKWFQDGVEIIGETNPTLEVEESATYTVEVQFASNCIPTDDIIVEFAENPTANEPQDIIECASVATDQDTFVMFDLTQNDAFIDLSNNPNHQVIYYASQTDFENGNSIPSSEASSYTNSSNPQTIIAEVVNTQLGCRSDNTVMFDLIVQPLPVLPSSLQMPQGSGICVDDQGNVEIPFEIGYDLGAIDGNTYTYDWTPDNEDLDGDGNEDAIFNINTLVETTTYSVIITQVNDPANGMPNCSNGFDENGREYKVTFEPSFVPFATQTTVLETSFNEGGEYTVTITPLDENGLQLPLNDYLYRVDDGPLQESNVLTNIDPGSHIGYAVNKDGCGEVGNSFMIIDYPRFFTPNGDGYNDTWNIIEIDNQPASNIYVFDRSGKLLKQLSPVGAGWDGSYNGQLLPSGDYWFSVNYIEPKTGLPDVFKANFTLKR